MISITDIESKLEQKEQGKFQIICNEILKNEGYTTFDRTGSETGTEKTISGTPDSIFMEDEKYVFAEFTTCQKTKLPQKIRDDIEKCFNLIDSNKLNGKVSKLIFMHNRKQPSLKIIEEIKKECQKRNIDFIIHGSDYISDIIQKKYSYIAEKYLDLKDYDKLFQISKNEIKESLKGEIVNKDINKISDRVCCLYKEASKITNIPSSIIYINYKNKEKLHEIYKELINLEYIYVGKNSEESKNYYHNILIILQRYDRSEYIKKFNEVEKYNILTVDDYNFYADNLMMENQANKALPILEKLYYIEKNESSFINLIRCYFLLNQYDKVISELSPLSIEKYDKLGILATFLVLSKNFIKELKSSEILTFNNKFKNMPVYYASTAQLLYKLNSSKYKTQLKKALNCVKNDDYVTINLICDISIEIEENQTLINYLMKMNNQNELIKIKLIKLLEFKKTLSPEEIKYLEKNINGLEEKEIDINYLQGIINENKGLMIKSLTYYKKSYISTNNNYSLNKYIILSIRTKNKIDESIFPKVNDIKDYRISMLLAEAYKFMGNIESAVELSYNSLYLLENTHDNEPYKQFWSIIMMRGNELKKGDKIGLKDSVIVLKNTKHNELVKYIVDDSSIYKENNKIADLTIIKSNSKIALKILGKKIKDTIVIENNSYEILNIEEKYKYLVGYCFNIVKNVNGIKIFTSEKDNNNSLKQISETLSDISKNMDNKLNIYESEEKLPLSSLISSEHNFDEYAKLMNTLLSNEHLLYAGETINLDLEKGFVIDVTSLITLTLLGRLDILTDDLCKKIFISKTLKNKFDYYFENLISTYNKKETMIGYNSKANNKYNLVLQEIPNKDKVELWKELNECINKFQVLDIEFELDKIVNYESLNILDKVQFDLIKVAQDKNIPFICDDFFIRTLCNMYKVSHTNTNFLINYNVTDFNEYIQNLITLSKYNYIYSVYNDEWQKIIHFLINNFDEDNKNLLDILITQLLSNKKSEMIYKPFLINIMQNCEKLKFVKIFGEIFENKVAFFLCDIINNKI